MSFLSKPSPAKTPGQKNVLHLIERVRAVEAAAKAACEAYGRELRISDITNDIRRSGAKQLLAPEIAEALARATQALRPAQAPGAHEIKMAS